MGRKTFEAIGRVLPGRTNIVLTRTPSAFTNKLAQTISGSQPIYTNEVGLAQTLDKIGAKCAFIIGGSEVYGMFSTKATEIYLTKINKHYDCDSFFPDVDATKYHLKDKSIEYYSEQEACTFHYEHYKKIS
jgi:dihydrofolate reductase